MSTKLEGGRKVKIMDVTPAVAEKWLNANTHNRPLRDLLVEKYVKAMKAGEWRLTAEPIAFSKPFIDTAGVHHKETLIEGQHRLWAVVNSGVTVQMTVWFGCEKDEFEVIGQGATRTQGDIMAVNHPELKDPTTTTSVITSLLRYGFSHTDPISAWQVRVIFDAFTPELIAATEDKKKLRKLAQRPVVSSLFLCRLINPGMTDLMVTSLREAVGFTERDPMRALHFYLNEQLQIGGRRDSKDALHYKTCHALCCKLRGDPLKILKITTEGLKWQREATAKRIEPVVREVYGGRMPKTFYEPQIFMAAEDQRPVSFEKMEAVEARMTE